MKTRAECEAILRQDNPMIDGASSGDPVYEAKILSWVESMFASQAEIEADAERSVKKQAAANSVTGLRTWSAEAATAVNAWDGWTQAQKNAAMKTVITRFGTLCDRMADLIEGNSLDK